MDIVRMVIQDDTIAISCNMKYMYIDSAYDKKLILLDMTSILSIHSLS